MHKKNLINLLLIGGAGYLIYDFYTKQQAKKESEVVVTENGKVIKTIKSGEGVVNALSNLWQSIFPAPDEQGVTMPEPEDVSSETI